MTDKTIDESSDSGYTERTSVSSEMPPEYGTQATEEIESSKDQQLINEEQARQSCWERRPKVVEPFLVLYHLCYWIVILITDQCLYSHIYHGILSEATNAAIEIYKNSSEPHPVEGDNTSLCSSTEGSYLTTAAQTETDQWIVLINLYRSLPAVFTTFIICSYTDNIGRKFGLILPCVGGFFKTLILVVVFRMNIQYGWILLGSFVEGLFGGHITFVGTSFSYLADVTIEHPKTRTYRFTILHALLFGSMSIANIATGYIMDRYGFLNPLTATCGIFLVVAVSIIALLPESFQTSNIKYNISVASIARDLISSFKIYTKEREDINSKKKLLLLLLAFSIHGVFLMGIFDVTVLYAVGFPFCFDTIQLGYYTGLNALCLLLGELVLIRIMLCCLTDNIIGIAAAFSGLCGYLVTALAPNGTVLYISCGVGTLSPAVVPLIRSMMSKLVNRREQGSLQASVSTVEVMCDFCSSLLLNSVYLSSLGFFAGFIFIVCAMAFLGEIIILGIVWTLNRRNQAEETQGLVER